MLKTERSGSRTMVRFRVKNAAVCEAQGEPAAMFGHF